MNELVPRTDLGNPRGFGAPLGAERQRQGLTPGDVAARLRLSARQIQALEQEDLARLPAPPYVRGFLRNYARELKLDPAPLVAAYAARFAAHSAAAGGDPDSATAQVPAELPAGPLLERYGRRIVLAGLVLALVALGLIGSVGRQAAPAATAPGAVADPGPGALTPAAPLPVVPPAPGGASGAGLASLAPGAPGAGSAAPDAGAANPASLASAATMANAASAANAANATTTAGSAGAPGAAGSRALVLKFSGVSWVQVAQADGTVLASHTSTAGSFEQFAGTPPLRVTIGNAPSVRLEYRGQPVDLAPFTQPDQVARLTLP